MKYDTSPTPDRIEFSVAESKFDELIERVTGGAEIAITRDGAPVALVVPFKPAGDRGQAASALAELTELGAEVSVDLTPQEIKDAVREGRR